MHNELVQRYNEYLGKNNCSNLHPILNKFSRADALVHSGDSSVILEHKLRTVPIQNYQSCMLGKSNFDSLHRLAFGLNASILFICEYTNFILMYDITNKMYEWESMPSRSNNDGYEQENKEVCLLSYYDADFIISKKTWNRGRKEQLKYYSELKKLN